MWTMKGIWFIKKFSRTDLNYWVKPLLKNEKKKSKTKRDKGMEKWE